MKLKNIQEQFKTSLICPERNIAQDFEDIFFRGAIDIDQRLGIYRNNLSVSLQNILMDRHELLRVVVGENFLRALIREYVRDNRPSHGNLNDYGFDFPRFIDQHKAVKPLPYLGDVARLECSWWRSYYAKDAKPLDLKELSKLPANQHSNLKLVLHPSVRLIRSAYPVFSIRELCLEELGEERIAPQASPNAAQDPDQAEADRPVQKSAFRGQAAEKQKNEALLDITAGGEFGMTLRPYLKTIVCPLEEAHLKFLVYLRNDHTIGEAYGKVLARYQSFDLRRHLQEELKRGTFIAYRSAAQDKPA